MADAALFTQVYYILDSIDDTDTNTVCSLLCYWSVSFACLWTIPCQRFCRTGFVGNKFNYHQ